MLPNFEQTYDQLLNLRFELINEITTNTELKPTSDFYMDLLAIFHAPEKFEVSTFSQYPLEVVLDYLRQTHRLYLKKYFSDIEASIDAISSETATLRSIKALAKNFFFGFRDHLAAHIKEEETDLFPYIDVLVRTDRTKEEVPPVLHQQNPLHVIADHNDDLEEDLSQFIKALEEIHQAHQESFGYRMLMTRLHLFEHDLRIHGRLEDEVLIPRALELQQEVLA